MSVANHIQIVLIWAKLMLHPKKDIVKNWFEVEPAIYFMGHYFAVPREFREKVKMRYNTQNWSNIIGYLDALYIKR